MEFHEKLQELRKNKGLTQEELAEVLFVSRAAVSKWESGRGYPNIDSLKAIAQYFGVTVDQLLSGEQVLTIAQEDRKQQQNRLRDLVFGLLDISVALFFFLPVFAQRGETAIRSVSLLNLTGTAPYLKVCYVVSVSAIILWGIGTLALQGYSGRLWLRYKSGISILLGILGTLLLIVSSQPYAAAFAFVFLIVKVLILIKKP